MFRSLFRHPMFFPALGLIVGDAVIIFVAKECHCRSADVFTAIFMLGFAWILACGIASSYLLSRK